MNLGALSDRLCTSDARYGRITHFRDDDPIGVSLADYGEWAQLELDLLARLVSPGDLVIDIGANVGTHTLAFASFVGTDGCVLSFEPQPLIRTLLSENVRQNGLRQVTVEELAISDVNGPQVLSVPDYQQRHNSGVATLAGGQNMQVQVETRRLDEFGIDRCALIKLDVEGWEQKALKGALNTLERCQPILYVECNSMERGWALISLLNAQYEAWLHAPSAYNPANFRRNSVNRFGIAQETSLVLVPRSRSEGLRQLLSSEPNLSEVPDLDAFGAAFTRATRYGESQIRPEQAQALARRVQELEQELARHSAERASRRVASTLKRPVHVLVPIYNGFEDFRQLAHSLFNAHPVPDAKLKFVFIDDASPDPRIAEFLSSPIFDRPDVIRLSNPENLGFIRTVNRGFELYATGLNGTDLIILNSDTQIHRNVFAILQDVADRLPNVASVTPMTNSGTIASIWNWPEGSDLGDGISPALVARAVEQAEVPTTVVSAPTGIGFCMYMTKHAIEAVGGFDPVFGRGYGEENHWCQTAAKFGFLNLLTTEAFVYHHGSQSFGEDLKREQMQRNMSLLTDIHPGYPNEVSEYVQADPLKSDRFKLLWAIRRLKKEQDRLHTFLFVLHSDPAHFGGGTERHVMALTDALLASGGAEVLHLYLDTEGRSVLDCYLPPQRASNPRQPFATERFELDDAFALLSAIAPDVDTLHVHHFLGWPRWFAQVPALFARSRKFLSLHDFFAICPSIKLLSNGRFCGVPSDLHSCNGCLVEQHDYRDSSIEGYRGTSGRFMQMFDRVIVPSESAKEILLRGFEHVSVGPGTSWARVLRSRVDAVSNFLLQPPEGPTSPRADIASRSGKPRLVYLGAFVDSKGGGLFSEASSMLLQRGYDVEVWGALAMPVPPNVTHRTYAGSAELRTLAENYPVDVVLSPAMWPETFSFTLFEAVLELGAAVVVGPWGNPAEVVRRHGVGIVLDNLSVEKVMEAVEQCIEDRGRFSAKLKQFRQHYAGLNVERFINDVYGTIGPNERRELSALNSLPSPSRRRIQPPIPPPAPPAPPAPPPPPPVSVEIPLRYRVVDQTNAVLKRSLPWVHSVSKWLASRTQRFKLS